MVQNSGASFGNSNSFSHDASPFRVSDDFRILRVRFESSVYVIDVSANISYAALCDEIQRNVNGLVGVKFVLSYVISDGPKCVVRNDRDTLLMMYSQRRLGGDFVDMFVDRVGVESASNDVVDDLVFDGGVEPAENFEAGVRRPGRVLLSSLWRQYISHVNQEFVKGASDFRLKLAMYAAEVGFDYVLTKNNKTEITAECKRRLLERCKWRVHASISHGNGAFYIRTLNNEHSCCGFVRDDRSSALTSKVVAHLIAGEVKSNPAFSPKDALEYIKVVYGFEISYWNAWKGRELAGKEVLGNDSASYTRLVRYLQVLKESNPGSYCVLEVDGASRRFQRVFVSFAASISGFKFCRPVLCLDGTFLKNKFKGTLLVAVGKDGNQGLYPLAFAIVGSETQENWKWFVDHVAVILRDQEREITFLTDRNPGLLNAVSSTFPGAPHGYCFYHMKNNLLAKFPGSNNTVVRQQAVGLFKKCAYAPTKALFHRFLNEFLALDRRRIQSFLKGAGFSNWANAYFPGERYGDMCSNVAESFNSWIRTERTMPITELIDGIRMKMMRLISFRNDMVAKWTSQLCPEMEKKLVENAYFGRHFVVVKSNEAEYEVDDGGKVSVNVMEGSCSCQVWRINSFSCPHAAAVFKRTRLDPYKLIDPYFWSNCFKACYSFPIHPIPDEVNDDIEAFEVHPPETRRQAGRPRTRRFKPWVEGRRQMKCSRCGKKVGHNRKSCNEAI